MPESHTLFENVIFWGIVTFAGCAAFLSVLTYQRLKSHHPDLYSDLGSPGVLLTLPADARQRVSRFMWSGEYRGVADPYLKRLFGGLRLVAILAITFFVAGVVTFLLRSR
jgi:hypothetical protein